jgi:hypothetical protein
MNLSNKQALTQIAEEVLDKLEEVSASAHLWLVNPNSLTMDSLTPTSQTEKAALEIIRIKQKNRAAYQRLIKEPFVSRVVAEGENGAIHTYFFCRADQGMVERGVISYLTQFGRLASIPVGDEFLTPLGEYLLVISKAGVRPEMISGIWNAHSVIQRKGWPSVTVKSLRALLSPLETETTGLDILDEILADEAIAGLAREGVQRSVIARMGLRDQPIMDKFQDEIFRLPLQQKLMILGPAGTGKTTTLIRRLGQKLDVQFLDDDERRIVKEVGVSQHLPHENSWLMFTPTELLRQYLKEAFAREGVPAPDRNIRTWDEHRRELCRKNFGILRTTTGAGLFIYQGQLTSLQDKALHQPIDWFNCFDEWQRNAYLQEMGVANDELIKGPNLAARDVGRRIKEILNDDLSFPSKLTSLASEVSGLQPIVAAVKKDVDQKIKAALVAQLERNRNFLTDFGLFLDGLRPFVGEESDEASSDAESGWQASKGDAHAAASMYMLAVRTLTRNTARKKTARASSRMGIILEWLKGRTLPVAELRAIGKQLVWQAAAQHMLTPVKRYINDVGERYKAFRREMQVTGEWYQSEGFDHREIHPLELDAILLTILRGSAELLDRQAIRRKIDEPLWEALKSVTRCFRHQIFVDEATDFSPLQLACMHALSNPKLRSFFGCGDFNQRLTTWGVKSRENLSWSIPGLDIRTINVAYRQSKQLNDLAHDIVQAAGGTLETVNLPSEVDGDVVAPALLENSSTTEAVRWLAACIGDIERLVGQLPSIAVFVTSEADVESTAAALEPLLAAHNIRVAACREGQALGQESCVRVFDIAHIKGMEFEAVFFLGVDRLAARQPELFDKYIYVGVTRAAAYLGLACEGILPTQLASVRHHFVSGWQKVS